MDVFVNSGCMSGQMIRLTSFGDVILSGNDRGDVWFEASYWKLILLKI